MGLEHAQRLELGLASGHADGETASFEVADLCDAAVGERHEMQMLRVGTEQVADRDALRQPGEPALGRGPGHVGLRQRKLDLALLQELHVLGGAARLRRHGIEVGVSRDDVGHRRAERIEHAALAGGADEELRTLLRMQRLRHEAAHQRCAEASSGELDGMPACHIRHSVVLDEGFGSICIGRQCDGLIEARTYIVRLAKVIARGAIDARKGGIGIRPMNHARSSRGVFTRMAAACLPQTGPQCGVSALTFGLRDEAVLRRASRRKLPLHGLTSLDTLSIWLVGPRGRCFSDL